MTKLNRKVEYALLGLQHLSTLGEGERASAKEIAERVHAPFEPVARALQVLAGHQLVRADYGVNGGYALGPGIESLSLFDLLEALEGSTALVRCLSTGEGCELKATCTIADPIQELNQRITEFYKSVRIKELLRTQLPNLNPTHNEKVQ